MQINSPVHKSYHYACVLPCISARDYFHVLNQLPHANNFTEVGKGPNQKGLV